jgi:hypothetical protein
MRSLTAHLRQSEAHGRLPFHPSCPICRESRLVGQLPVGGVVSPRTRALLATSVLAVSVGAPAATALADEHDQEQVGTTPVAPTAPEDPADSPDVDPNGDDAQLPDAPPDQDAPSGDDDQSGAVAPPAPVVDPGDGSDPSPTPTAATSPAPVTTPAPTTTAAPIQPTPTPVPSATPAAPAEATPAPTETTAAHARRRTRRSEEPRPHRQVHTVTPQRSIPRVSQPVRVASAESSPRAVPVADPPSHPEMVRTALVRTTAHPARSSDHVHTVHAGESLWAIASDVLGGDASPAQVAREVHRLWTLNKDRIGTGNPDLLMVGTRLALR